MFHALSYFSSKCGWARHGRHVLAGQLLEPSHEGTESFGRERIRYWRLCSLCHMHGWIYMCGPGIRRKVSKTDGADVTLLWLFAAGSAILCISYFNPKSHCWMLNSTGESSVKGSNPLATKLSTEELSFMISERRVSKPQGKGEWASGEESVAKYQ